MFGPGVVRDAGHRPAAEVERGRERRERERGAELADEEEEEAEAGVLDHVAGDELALGDRHVERGLRELGLRGDEEEGEPDELREDERVADASPTPKIAPLLLRSDDALQAHRAGLDHHADDREQQRELVGDELARPRAARRAARTCSRSPSRP